MQEPTPEPALSQDTQPKAGLQPAGLYGTNTAIERIASLETVDDDHIASFHQQGYLVIDQVFDQAQVEDARRAIDDLIDGANPKFRGVQLEAGIGIERAQQMPPEQKRRAVRKLMSFADYDPRLKAMAEHPGTLTLLHRLMADPPLLFQEMALLKGPGGREKPWHQDCAYFNVPLGTPVIGVWIALDEATPQNGCLHLIPGSHKEGPVEHFNRRDWQICDTQVQTKRDVAVPLPAGGALFWHGMVHHGSPTNGSDNTRRALQFHYKPTSSGQISTEERMQYFGGEVRGAQC